MIVGFDAKRAAQNRTGLGNYSRYIARILKQYARENEYVLFYPNRRRATALQELPGAAGYTHVTPRGLWSRLGALWRTVALPAEIRRHGVALYHGLSNELPLGIRRAGCRTVVTIHDVIFMHQPEYYKPVDRWIYRWKFRYAGRVADRVVTVSEFSKQELTRLLGIPAEKIDVVYPGIYLDFSKVTPHQRATVAERYGLPRRFVLYVGTIEERKNLMLVAQAMASLKAEGRLPKELCVAVVGRRTPYTDTLQYYIADQGLAAHFLFLHNVTFADLPAVYQLADYLVYPSRIEGFGSPMLEAAAAGLPAIGCTGSSLEEAGGPGGCYVGPDDVDGMARCMMALWDDPLLRRERSAMGLAHAERFGERRLFDDLMAVYAKII